MNVALISDIHAEFYRSEPNWLPPLPDNADVVVLGGDIHIGAALIDFVNRIAAALPECHLVVVAGNHEFYRQYRKKTLTLYRQAFIDNHRIHFLENDYVDINDVRFIGATLWTGFPLFDDRFTKDEVMAYAKDTVSDFDFIADDSDSGNIKAFTPEVAEKLFLESKSAIDTMLEQSDARRTIVITHFPPLQALRNPRFEIEKMTSYFTADCSEIVRKHRPAYWFYGHNHWSASADIDGTTFISNQLGYPNELWKTGGVFDRNLNISL